MPLGLGLGLGVGRGAVYPPVSSWPTVADIPPGVRVLDADGVVKQKVGDYLIPVPVTIIGSGPLASAPVASADNLGLWYNSTDFGPCLSRPVVELSGPDLIVASATRLIANSPVYTFLVKDVNAGVSTIGRFGRLMSGSSILVFLYITAAGKFEAQIRQLGGAQIAVVTSASTSISNGLHHKIDLRFTASSCSLYIDNVFDKTVPIVGWDGVSFSKVEFTDIDADIRPVQIAKLSTSDSFGTADCWQMNETSGTVIANQCTPSNPATLSDGTAHAYSWVPWSLLQ